MVAGQRVRVRGADTVARTMRDAAAALDDMSGATRTAAGILARAAQGNAPHRTGRLAASIRVSTGPGTGAVTAGGNGVRYAGPIEGGWRRRNIAPRLYLRRALDAQLPAMIGAYSDDVAAATKQIRGV